MTLYLVTLSFGAGCIVVACIALAYYTRAWWKFVAVPVFLIGLVLLTVLALRWYGAMATPEWLFYDAPVIIPVVKVGG